LYKKLIQKACADLEESNVKLLGNFFIAVFEPLIVGNLGYYNTMFSFLNQLPEFLLVLFGPYLGLFILGIGVFYNMFSLICNWVTNLGWMFKKNANIIIDEKTGNIKPGPGAPEWQNVRWSNLPDPDNPDGKKGSSEWGSCIFAVFLVFIFIGILMSLFISQILLITSVVLAIFFVITFLMYKTKLAGKNISITELFMYFFKYNKLIIMSIFSFHVISNSYKYFGPTSAGFAVLTLFCIYYFKIIEMFVPIKTDQDERVEVEINSFQAYKEPCDPPPEKEEFKPDSNLKYASSMDRARLATSFTGQPKKDLGIRKSLPSLNLFGKKPEVGTGPGQEVGGPEVVPEVGAPGPGQEVGGPGVVPEVGAPEPDRETLLERPLETPVSEPQEGPIKQPGYFERMKVAANNKFSNLKESANNKFSNLKDSASNRFGNLFNRSSPPPIIPDQRANQLGGKKRKPLQIDPENLVRELKKFNKKYAQFLL
jgi:hypothetical protein